MSDEEVRAFVPGHITGFFTIHEGDDPTETGSRGGGLTLTDGVTVTVHRGDNPGIYLNDTNIEMEPVRRVLDALGTPVTVVGETTLPVGAGFGVSGAMALGTALAVAELRDLELSENELVTIAHGAEVQSGTGLGDVVAQARGGMPIRLEPGGPEHNYLDGLPARPRVEYYSVGERSTEAVLAGDDGQLSDAGRTALSRLVADPTLETFMEVSRLFSRKAGLVSDDLAAVIEDVSEVDGSAAVAMLGETVFALDDGLTEAGYDATSCRVDTGGATLVDPTPK
jgi:pantoate kinase